MRSMSSFYLHSILSRTQPLRMSSANLLTPFRYWHFSHKVKAAHVAQQDIKGRETESHGVPLLREGDEIRAVQRQTAHGSARKLSTWAKWLLGSVVAVILPYWQTKWQKFLRIEGEIEAVAEKVEGAVKTVEKVAAVTEKVSAEVADSLPSNGKLKDAALFVEHASEEAKKEAELVLKLIHEVTEAKEDVETIIEPIIHAPREGRT